MELPVRYDSLSAQRKKIVREKYVELQGGLCFYCKGNLSVDPPKSITNKKINWKLFPVNFLKYPIHLQHCHKSGLTEGAVHAYCNAVMWQYENR